MAGGAAANANFGTRFFDLIELSQFGKELGDGFFPYAAGIDENQISLFGGFGECVTLFRTQFRDHVLTVADVHGAPKGFYENFGGVRGHKMWTWYI